MAKPPRQKIISKKHLARQEREQLQRRYLIFGSIAVLLIVLGVIVYGVLDQTVLQANRAVAKVDGQTITLKQFQTRASFDRMQLVNQYNSYLQMSQLFGQDPTTGYFASTLQQIQSQLNTTDTSQLGTMVLDQLINDDLVAHEAQKMGITVTDQEVDKRIQEFFQYYPNGTPTPAPTGTEVVMPTLNPTTLAIVTITPTPTEAPTDTPEPSATPGGPTATVEQPTPNVTATPAPTATPYTEQGYQTEVKNYSTEIAKYGITQADLRQIFRSDLLRQKMMDKITADVKPEEDQVWARQILLPDQGAAQAALERIKKGEDFCKVAKEVSTDTSNKDQCGDLGWFGKGKMVAEFETAAFALKVGQISDPVKSSFGFHIIQVLGHEVRPLTADEISQAKQAEFTKWLSAMSSDPKRVQKFDDVWQNRVPTEPALPATTG